MHSPASLDGSRSRLTIAFFADAAELDQVAAQVVRRAVCLLNDLPLGALEALDDGRRRVVVLSFAQSYQWVEYWTGGSRAVDVWLVVPSGIALRSLISERPAGGQAAVTARLLRYLGDAIPRERWLDLNDPRFGKTVALRLCGAAEAEGLHEPEQGSPCSVRGRFALSVGRTYRTIKGELGLSLLEAGWSHAEAAHVWSNGRSASIVLPVDPDDARAVRCRLAGFHIGRPFRVQVLVDGQSVLRRTVSGEGAKTLDLLIPLDCGGGGDPGLRRVELCFSQTWSPCRLYAGSTDQRELAVALSAISLEAAEDDLDAATLDVVGGLRSFGLGGLAPVTAQQTGPSFADLRRAEMVDAGCATPVIVLVDVPEPGAVLAALQPVLGAEGDVVYLLCVGADERQASSQAPAPESPHSACFADSWERIVQALRFIERAPDILVVADINQAVEASALLMPALALSAPVRVMIVMSDDTGAIRRHKKFLSGSMETITLHDGCTVLRARRQVL